MLNGVREANSNAVAAEDAVALRNLHWRTLLVLRKKPCWTNLNTRPIVEAKILVNSNPAHTRSFFLASSPDRNPCLFRFKCKSRPY
jgi:hypothetical protein